MRISRGKFHRNSNAVSLMHFKMGRKSSNVSRSPGEWVPSGIIESIGTKESIYKCIKHGHITTSGPIRPETHPPAEKIIPRLLWRLNSRGARRVS
ncbi:hypothetical protein AcW1_003168 [Taiwanofungus camphoratus]|nr:hypothetical protein AcV5_001642 [Antrodia cinnamomea]KAI0942576.1 hypothetical protein AcW1_003168 [Antrodia cinnamomea]